MTESERRDDPVGPPSSPPSPDDATLMARTRAGDRQAFARVVERHGDRLVGYLARLTGSPESAEDLAQETFLRLYRAAGPSSAAAEGGATYRERGELAAYLYRIATNLARSERRRERRWHLLHPLLAASQERVIRPRAGEHLLGRELGEQIEAALARLSPKLREALVLHEIEGVPVADAARILGCREGTVKSRLHRARKRLEAALAPYRESSRATALTAPHPPLETDHG